MIVVNAKISDLRGQELNIVVARRMFGWSSFCGNDHIVMGYPPASVTLSLIPDYTSWAGMELIVTEMRGWRWLWKVYPDEQLGMWSIFERSAAEGKTPPFGGQRAESLKELPTATARAALIALQRHGRGL